MANRIKSEKVLKLTKLITSIYRTQIWRESHRRQVVIITTPSLASVMFRILKHKILRVPTFQRAAVLVPQGRNIASLQKVASFLDFIL
jgi:hypothetical protein